MPRPSFLSVFKSRTAEVRMVSELIPYRKILPVKPVLLIRNNADTFRNPLLVNFAAQCFIMAHSLGGSSPIYGNSHGNKCVKNSVSLSPFRDRQFLWALPVLYRLHPCRTLYKLVMGQGYWRVTNPEWIEFIFYFQEPLMIVRPVHRTR